MPTYLSGSTSSAASGLPMDGMDASPRPSYALMQNRVNTTPYYVEAYFYDAEFRKIGSASVGTGGWPGAADQYDGSRVDYNYFYNATSTTAVPSSNGTDGYMNATNASGEFGNDCGWASERGTSGSSVIRFFGNRGYRSSFSFINSDHSDKRTVLSLDGGVISSNSLWSPATPQVTAALNTRKVKTLTSTASGNTLTSMYGSMSYNNVRKELVQMVYNTTTSGRYDIHILKGIDLDLINVDATNISMPAAPAFSINIGASGINQFSGATTESQYRVSPVLCDDGSIFFTCMFPSTALRVFKIVRAADDLSGTVSLIGSQSLTTSYGLEQGTAYGMKTMQSRNGQLVASFCPYYYYGSGISLYVVDKRQGAVSQYQSTNNDIGWSVVKYRDDGFALYANQPFGYSYGGQGVNATIYPRVGQQPAVSQTMIALPGSPTGNGLYPALTHVWEFNLQSQLPV